MNVDTELEQWRQEWQSQDAVLPDLRKRVERQSRLMKLGIVADTLVTITMGGGTTAWAVISKQTDTAVLAAFTWLIVAVAWLVRLKITRGTWSPAGMNSAAYVDLLMARSRGQLAAIRFGAVLYVTNVVFCLTWIYHHSPEQQRPVLQWLVGSMAMDLVWVVTAGFYGLLIWYLRRKRAELEYLVGLEKEL
jgi:hypothetical protein